MLTFQQSETTAERRRWMLHLVDASDGITPETGVTGQGWITKNGATPVQTTNSLVEVDTTNMPGFYYLELTASELDTLGFIGFRFDSADTAEFQDRALVSYNDPYVSAGGFSSGTTVTSAKLTKKQLDYIAEQMWNHVIADSPAKELLIKAASIEQVVTDLTPVLDKIGEIKTPELDLTPVLDRISKITIPVPKDHTKNLADITKTLVEIHKVKSFDFSKLDGIISKFNEKVVNASKEITETIENVNVVREGFEELETQLAKFSDSLDAQIDMDRRFGAMSGKLKDEKLEEVIQKINKLANMITEAKFDILGEIK